MGIMSFYEGEFSVKTSVAFIKNRMTSKQHINTSLEGHLY